MFSRLPCTFDVFIFALSLMVFIQKNGFGNNSSVFFTKIACLFFLIFVKFSGNDTMAQARVIINNGSYIVLNGGYLVLGNSATNAITRITSGHVISESENSRIKWNIGANNGNYEFPFGKCTGVNCATPIYIPFVFNISPGNEGDASGSLTLSTWATDAANNPLPSGGYTYCPATAEVMDRFWFITEAYTTNPTAAIRFYYTVAELDGISEGELKAQRGNLALTCPWETPPVGSVNTTDNYVEVAGVSNFSPWTLVRESAPLPIELLYFNAFAKDNKIVRTEWTTATEINNDYFAIERSQDGIVFEQIGTMQGANNSSITLHYVFYDEYPYTGLSYYRLRQVDIDGQFSYSEIRAVYLGDFDLISIYPNPSSDYIQYLVASQGDDYITVRLLDVLGREVLRREETIEKGVTAKTLNVSGISNGSYLLQIATAKQERKQKQFMIK